MTCSECKTLIDINDLSAPYIVRKCSSCGREIKLREPGEKGHGIKIEKGDQFVLPDGWLKISANPLNGTGYLSKYGLEWFAKLIFLDELPNRRENIQEEIEKNDLLCLDFLKRSELLKDYDLEDVEQADKIFQILNERQSSSEWWVYLFATFNAAASDAIEENDAKKAVWAVACAERCRSMFVFKENLEEVVWMGHSAKRIVDVIGKWDANKNNNDEEFWQQIFNRNPYILSQVFSVPVVFIKDKAYVGGMSVDKQDAKFVDYLYTNESSKDAMLVEIKTPETRLLGARYRQGVYRPSSDLSGSIVQVLDYRRELSRNIRQITEGTSHKIDVFNPRCIVIAGNANQELDDDTKRKSFELFRTNLRDIEIVTYDELFRKAEVLATLFNLVRQTKET